MDPNLTQSKPTHPLYLNRRTLLAASTGFLLAAEAYGQGAPAVTATKLSNNLYLLMGDGGNIAVGIAEDGLIMVDAGVPESASALLKAVSGVNPQPVRLLFNTHWHFDHTGANEVLGRAGTRIMAHENVRTRMSSDQVMESLNRKFSASPAIALPTVTFSDGGSLYHGGEKLQYQRVPPSHTDGDSYVFFTNANVLHAGDLYFNGFYPVIDYSTGGWIGGMISASDQMLKVGDSQTRIIPGHGPLSNRAELKSTRDMLATVYDRLKPMAAQNKTTEQVLAAAPTKDLDDKWGKGFMTPENFVRAAYTSILRHGR